MSITIIIPIVSAVLYRFGGMDQIKWIPVNQKIWRWLGIGLFIGIMFMLLRNSYKPLLVIPMYIIAIQGMPYGEKSWLNFLPKWTKFTVSGIMYGLAGFALLGPVLAIIQGIVGAVAYLVLMVLDDKEIVKNPYQELLRGALGTILFLAVK